tara:strand:- start:9 stop:293 length:285 start_codon:yes stop_codon:yes gene_type:complete
MEGTMKHQKTILVGLAIAALVFAPDARANPLKDPMPWLVPQIYSATVGPIGGGYTPTDFAIARGDIRSVSKIRILQDVLKKSGVDTTKILQMFR